MQNDSIRVKTGGNALIEAKLKELVGTEISVTWSSVPLHSEGFHTAVSVRGELEVHPGKIPLQFRVLKDSDCYAYFDVPQVMGILEFSKGWRVFVG
jgi:hypothetical protein